MIKHFCDKCGVEINEKNKFTRTKFKVGGLSMMLNGDGPWDMADALCNYCVVDEVKALLDDRPTSPDQAE